CRSLESIRLPDSMTTVGEKAFHGCVSLRSVYLPRGLQSIGERAFESCSLKSISFPYRMSRIGERAFANCTELETVIMPEARSRIGAGVFAGCRSLSVLVVPEGLFLLRRKKDRWKVPESTQIIYRAELELSQLFAEWSSADLTPERRAELRKDIRERIAVLKKRNRLQSMEPLRENLHKVARAVEEQTVAAQEPTVETDVDEIQP
ncbi:MAG: leucine-rich repeat domain-containing protein, partial [Clostridia bacterium]|nr:leucine-rich repeat domain-containing protein [Clostridia bacterium]